jgi:hypothetical protein
MSSGDQLKRLRFGMACSDVLLLDPREKHANAGVETQHGAHTYISTYISDTPLHCYFLPNPCATPLRFQLCRGLLLKS